MSGPFESVFAVGLKRPGRVVADDPDIELLATILRERGGQPRVSDPTGWHKARSLLKIIRRFEDRSGVSERLGALAAITDAAQAVVALDADTTMPVNHWIERTRGACQELREALEKLP